ncbi:hypothetical protein [Nocardia sp. NPDC057030]|uniref:hypothetical protein n=1 Tax=unclassified Nocardia TaxID=2637762 RepID=UPI00362CE1F4
MITARAKRIGRDQRTLRIAWRGAMGVTVTAGVVTAMTLFGYIAPHNRTVVIVASVITLIGIGTLRKLAPRLAAPEAQGKQ